MKIETLKYLDSTLGRLMASLWPASGTTIEFPETPQKVLFIRPGGIGDAALLIPAIRAFARLFPEAVIDILAEKRNAEVFDFCPVIANIYCYDRPSDWINLWRCNYDVVVDTEQWHRLSVVFGRLFGGSSVVGFGTNERRRLLARSIDYDLNSYEPFNFLSLLEPWGVELPAKINRPFLELAEQGRGAVLEILKELPAESFAVLCPGGSLQEKSWEEDRFADLAGRLLKENIHCVVLGGKPDVAAAREVALSGSGLSLAGRTDLFESAVVLQMSKLVIANDTGLLHLAVGLNRPTVGIFGPSNPHKWGPFGENSLIVSEDLSCAPCSRFGSVPDCPRDWACVREISVEKVFKSALSLYQKTAAIQEN